MERAKLANGKKTEPVNTKSARTPMKEDREYAESRETRVPLLWKHRSGPELYQATRSPLS